MPQTRSKSSLTSNITTLYRVVGGRVRYYKVALHPTLFWEYILLREWGSIYNKSATGERREYFSHIEDIMDAAKRIIQAKERKGYMRSLAQSIDPLSN